MTLVEQGRFDHGAIALAAAGEDGALGRRVVDQSVHPLRRAEVEQRAENDVAPRIAGHQCFGFGREFGDEFVRHRLVDDHALGRHANLALIHVGAERGGVDGRIDVGVVENEQRGLAAQLQQDRFEMPRRLLGDDAPDPRRTGEVDAFDRGVANQRLDQRGRVGGGMGDDIERARGQTRFEQNPADQLMRARAEPPRP